MRCRGTLLISEISLLIFLLVEIIWLNASPTSSLNIPDFFYIYDTGKWRTIANVTRNPRDPEEYMPHYLNSGAGPAVNITAGAYHTDQYQLFPLIFSRALKDPRRTLDPSKATTFIIPYDFASDSAFYKRCKSGNKALCFDFRKCPLAPEVSDLLLASPWYSRNYGKDHLLIIGFNYAMNHHVGKPKCKKLLTETCFNCTKIAIDEYSFLQATDDGIKEKGDFWHATPFPANFHWTATTVGPYPWENTIRPIVSSYVGSSQSSYNPAKKLRHSIVHYCDMHKDLCSHVTYGTNGTRSSHMVEGYNPLQVSADSVFCFQPIGDLMTRKGLFDSILQGCIPVTFDPLTASSMYTWHWEEEFWKSISIIYDFTPTAKRLFDPVLALRDLLLHNATLIAKKQALIRSRVFELQYSLHGKHETLASIAATASLKGNSNDSYGPQISDIFAFQVNEINENWPVDSNGRPMRDAYDVIMDHVLGWHSGKEADVRNATVPECWNGYLDIAMNKCRPHPVK